MICLILATLLTSQVQLSNAAAKALGAAAPEGSEFNPTQNSNKPVTNGEFTDFLASMWKFFQNVQNTNGQQTSGCSDNQNIICSILIKNSTNGQLVLTAVDYSQPMTAQQCAQLCQSNQSCVAYEITNITTSIRQVYPVSNSSGLNGQGCNCPTVVGNCPNPPANVELQTTTPSTTTTPTTTTTTIPTTTTTTTPATTRTYTAADKGVAFTATSSQSYSQVGGVIPLNSQSDYNSHFSNNQFSAVAGGLHFVEVCAGVQAGTPVNVRVQGSTNLQLGLTWNAKSQNGVESPCRSGLVQQASGSSLSLVLDSGVAYSDASNLNSLTVFSVSESMSDDSLSKLAYAYAPNSPPIVNNTLTPIPMKSVVTPANSAASFDASTATYTCGWTGPHIVSVSAGVMANTPTEIQITNQDINLGLTRTTVKFDGSTTQSRNVVINCVQGNKIQLNLVSGTVLDSDSTHNYNLTTFAVFPYIPRHVASPVSWGIYKWYIAFNNEQNTGNTGVIDPFYFTNVTVNQGKAYDANSRVLTVPSSGYYFTCITSGAGVGKNGATFTFSLMRNSETLIQVDHQSTFEGATDMFGRCAILKLNANDVIRAVGNDNSYFYSSITAYELSWIGFKLADL